MSESNVGHCGDAGRPLMSGRRRAFSIRAVLAVIVAAALVVSLTVVLRDWPRRADSGLIERLRSADPQERKLAAWAAADRGRRSAAQAVIQTCLEQGAESSPDVRETYVYALGRIGSPAHADVIEAVARTDESGYVRAAGWLALVRCNPARFEAVAGSELLHDEAWDQIGVAQGWLELGDFRGLDVLLELALRGNADQRLVAGRALSRGLRPVLEAVGRWPIEADPKQNEPWTAELVAEVRRRCRGLDLDDLAAEVRMRVADAARVHRDVGRLTGARERAARLLFSP